MMPGQIGKYEIRGTLGRGAMGTVLDGWDPAIERRVAIKTVRLADAAADEEAAEALERFRREAQAAGRLSHANIVGVFDTGQTEELAYIVMEFIEGRSLKQVLDAEKSLPPDEAAEIMGQVLAGLDFSHRRGVVHRDIKPANIMLTTDGGVKIADFGIARLSSSTATAVGSILGTPAYMPPEQFLGEPADARSDIFAAGATLFHLLTGTRPYEGNATSIMTRVLNADTPPLPSERAVGVSPRWNSVIRRAMAKRPENRFQSAAEFAQAVKAAMASAGQEEPEADVTMVLAAPKPVVSPHAAPAPSRSGARLFLFGGAAVMFLAAAGAAWIFIAPPAKLPAPATVVQKPPPPHAVAVDRIAPPPPSPASVRDKLAEQLASVPCAFVDPEIGGSGIRLSGIAGSGESEDAIRSEVSASPLPVTMDVQNFSGPYCPVVELLSPILHISRLQLAATDKPGPVTSTEFFHPVVHNLPFASWVQVDYFTGDGTVFHVIPMAGNAKSGLVAEPARLLPAGAELRLGEKGHTRFTPDKPFGNDLFVAVASSKKLFPGLRPQFEKSDLYVTALRAAIDRLQAAGGQVAAGFVLVKTVEK